MWWRSIFFMALFFGAVIAAIPNLLWLVCGLCCRIFSFKLPYAPFGYAALALLLIFWAMLAYGHFIGMWQVRTNEVEYRDKSVPAGFDGYRIVQISDLHADTFNGHPERLVAIIDKVNGLHPDLILFTGDMQTSSMDALKPHIKDLQRLSAPDGVKSVLGNHDFFIYSYGTNAERMAAADSLETMENRELGWQVLRNASMRIQRDSSGIVIAGVDNINGKEGFATIQAGDLGKALEGVGKDEFTILLSHDPSFWRTGVLPDSNARITLSGHTHAAQIRLFGRSLAALMFKENDGRYDTPDGRMLYVNAGLGCTVPFRFNCPSEITVITLRRD